VSLQGPGAGRARGAGLSLPRGPGDRGDEGGCPASWRQWGRISDGHRLLDVVLPLHHEELLSRDGDEEGVFAEHHCGDRVSSGTGPSRPPPVPQSH